MKKLLGYGITLLVLVGALFFPALLFTTNQSEAASAAAGEDSADPTTITDYRADFTLDRDGDLHVVETLKVDFSGTARHGIFRFWDRLDPSAPHARRIARHIRVTQDGDPAEVELSRKEQGRFDVARIGDPGVILSPTVHVYVISYDLDGVIEPGDGVDDPSAFYWNLIPAGWLQNIDEAHLTVHLPTSSGGVKCVIGTGDDAVACDLKGEGTDSLRIVTGAIAHNTPVTIQTGLDLPTPPPGTEVPWTGRFDPVLGQDESLLWGVLALAVAAGAAAFLLARRTHESDPQFPLMYAPPDGIGPAQGAYLLTESVDRTAYVASLMHAAQQGAVSLDKADEGWTVTDRGGAEGWNAVDPVTRKVAHLLGGPGASFTTDKKDVAAGLRLKTEIDGFTGEVKTWGIASGNLVPVGLTTIGFFLCLGGFGLALANLIWNPFHMTMIGAVPGAFGVFALPFLRTGAETKRTLQGRELWSRTGGFKRILSTPSAQDRFDFAGRQDLYLAYLPWAVAFGCADRWAAKYRAETGAEPPTPSYFGGYYAGSAFASVDSIVNDFGSTVDSAISSYNATQSSSSSGGGGFSGGGGGGGGGGGSW